MPTNPDNTHRTLYDPTPQQVTLRDADEVEDDEGMMEIRMPIASTGEVRNEGDDPLTSSELHGMAQQVDTLSRGVFPEHGNGDMVAYGKYSQFEKLGYWADADLQSEASEDSEDLLVATARMPDPETLPPTTGDYREALAILKEQAKRGIPISSSIGWRDDPDAPGGNDLMEASIVGIGADPRTSTEGGTEALARAAVSAGARPANLLTAVRAAVDANTLRDLTPEQADLASQLLERFTNSQGDASLRDFESWLWEQGDDLDGDAVTAAQTAIDEFCREMSPYDDPVSESFEGWLLGQGDGESDDMTDDDDTGEQNAGTTNDGEQNAPDEGDEQNADTDEDRQPDECPECDADVPDGANYCPNCGEELDSEGEQAGDGEDDEEDDEDDEEQSTDEPTEEQSAGDDEGDEGRGVQELHERLDSLESELADVRSGETDVDTPDPDADDDNERDADATEEQSEEPTETAESPTGGLGNYR